MKSWPFHESIACQNILFIKIAIKLRDSTRVEKYNLSFAHNGEAKTSTCSIQNQTHKVSLWLSVCSVCTRELPVSTQFQVKRKISLPLLFPVRSIGALRFIIPLRWASEQRP
ncbi:hypothetical protein SADUNF_Sadunf01G0034800 [Salix dunnii]|uniref:Uncharacterized protein n=1 Tax=Salix dunnii TaxID=1413687 RepID=A0A835TJU6_9ROSI|nr:hypothetical protein SADUNF_Sadunf01G0034800 [Salix dunnii]